VERKLSWSLIVVCVVLVSACAGPESERAEPRPLTQEQVVELTRQGVPPEEIVQRMDASGAVYELRSNDVRCLQLAGVDDRVIDYMLDTPRLARSVSRSLWYRHGQFYAPPPFSAYQGAYRFGD
jgi:hypothetical protein